MGQIEAGNGAQLPALEGNKLKRSDAARQAGLSQKQTRTAVNIAAIPADVFEREVEADKPATLTQLAQMGIKPRPLIAAAS